VYAGGDFTGIGGQARNYIAELDAATAAAGAWNPWADGPVLALALGEGTVFAGGSFHNIGRQIRNRVAGLDAVTGFATAFNANAYSTVRALAIEGGTLFAGGDFTSIGQQPRSRIAALNAATGAATAWNPGADNTVHALVTDGTTLYAAGSFGTLGGQVRTGLGQLDVATGAVSPAAVPIGLGSGVLAVALGGSTVYAGGGFSSVDDFPRTNLFGVTASIVGVPEAWPVAGFALRGIAPNPAPGAVMVEYEVGRPSRVRIAVFDVQGREVARLVDGMRPAGRQAARWDGRGRDGAAARPGIYVVQYQGGGRVESGRLVLLR
jgi:hypothetical protein